MDYENQINSHHSVSNTACIWIAQEKNWDQILYWGGSPQDQQKAVEVFQESCNKGELRACANLAFAYRSARGVTKDFAKSLELSKKACDGGDMWGCTNLGSLYKEGSGVKQDVSKAITLFSSSCDKGELRGCVNLGLHFYNAKDETGLH